MLNARFTGISSGELLEEFDKGLVVFLNLDTLMKMQHSEPYARLCQQADFVMADGQIVVLASKMLGTPLRCKVSGSDFFGEFCEHYCNETSVGVFLLGAGPGVADRARERINERIGREIVVGSHSPSYGFERNSAECQEIVDKINSSGATVLAVGLGAPKQELWIAQYRDRLPNITHFLPVGATLDFEAGVIPRAPAWMSASGMEWLFRLVHEPRRLWRRYLLEGPAVLALIVSQRLGLYQDPFDGGSVPAVSTDPCQEVAVHA